MKRCLPILAFTLVSACGTDSKAPAPSLLQSARAHLNHREYDLAIKDLDSALALNPNDAEALKSRGVAYKSKGKIDRALVDYDKALKIAPNNPTLYNDRGIAYESQGDIERAITQFDTAITLKPDYGLALRNRARAKFYLGRLPEAAADFRTRLNLDPKALYSAIWLHFINRRLGQDDTKELAAQYAQSDTIAWPAPVASYYLGRLPALELLRTPEGQDDVGPTQHRCAAAFYVGEQLLAKKQTADAVNLFRTTIASCDKESAEFMGAAAELKRLGASAK